jgi:hypothetical protein
MHTFADLAKALNRSTVYLSGLQSRFEIPVFDGASYSAAYLAFLQTVVHLRTLSITEETLRDLLPKRRLLLTNYELGAEVHGKSVQLGLNFADTAPNSLPGRRWAKTSCVSSTTTANSTHASAPT